MSKIMKIWRLLRRLPTVFRGETNFGQRPRLANLRAETVRQRGQRYHVETVGAPGRDCATTWAAGGGGRTWPASAIGCDGLLCI